jgi:DNA polymerase-1
MTIAVGLAARDELAGGGVAFRPEAEGCVVLPAHLLPAAQAFLEDPAAAKRVHDEKSAIHALETAGCSLAGVVDDTMLAAFLVDASRADFSLEKSTARYLGVALDADLARTADLIRRLGEKLRPELDARNLRDLYEKVELPLAPILARMESAGVKLDTAALAGLSSEMESKLAALSGEIFELAGSTFNINSPKQLAKVLFEDLELPPPPRRGKTRSLSTASDVLENLKDLHEIVAKILEYRQLTKLRGTYVDALPALIDPATGRLHTTFNQCGAATGRLSSSNPNLQNIPIRTELGREIRAAFIARPGWKLLAADYSQIELRILAHISADRVLLEAFRQGEDIHTRTAAEVFGVAPLMVGPEERRRAKAVNFGIVYGLSPFGLAKQLDIPQADARMYIDAYFERYSGVKKFMDKAIADARRDGHTRTLLGRLRPIQDLDSRNPAARGFAERTAINSPIQGSAADLIKLAMIRVDEKLRESGSSAQMLLQVHDELLFEVPEGEAAALAKLVKSEMEAVYKLDVPLVTDVKAGDNWRDMSAV